MSSLPEQKRIPLYYAPPSRLELGIEDGLEFLAPIYQRLFLDPDFTLQRALWESMLRELNHYRLEACEDGLDPIEALIMALTIQGLITTFGIATGYEVEAVINNPLGHFEKVNMSDKYITLDELKELTAQQVEMGKVVGANFGAFDPPHAGHARLIYQTWAYCDFLIVGVDSDAYLRFRKGTDRPRLPLYARLWQLAALPTVDKVFIVDFEKIDEEKYFKLYKDLHITVLGTAKNNSALPQYKKRMKKLRGKVIAFDGERYSSTEMTSVLNDASLWMNTLLTFPDVLKRAQEYDALARRAWGIQ